MWRRLDYHDNAQRGVVPQWTNEMAGTSWLYWLTFDGICAARAVRGPTVMVHSDGCVLLDDAISGRGNESDVMRLLYRRENFAKALPLPKDVLIMEHTRCGPTDPDPIAGNWAAAEQSARPR